VPPPPHTRGRNRPVTAPPPPPPHPPTPTHTTFPPTGSQPGVPSHLTLAHARSSLLLPHARACKNVFALRKDEAKMPLYDSEKLVVLDSQPDPHGFIKVFKATHQVGTARAKTDTPEEHTIFGKKVTGFSGYVPATAVETIPFVVSLSKNTGRVSCTQASSSQLRLSSNGVVRWW
jgi:hypothetical protein